MIQTFLKVKRNLEEGNQVSSHRAALVCLDNTIVK